MSIFFIFSTFLWLSVQFLHSPPHIRCIVSGAWLRDLRIGFSLGRSQVSYSLSSAFLDHCYRNLGFPQPNTRIACCLHYGNSPSLPPVRPVYSYYPSLSFPSSPAPQVQEAFFLYYPSILPTLLYLFTHLWTLIGLHHSHLPSGSSNRFPTYRDVPCFGYTGYGHWSICISS